MVKIRVCTSSDAKTLAELGLRTFVETFGAVNTEENMTAYLDANFSTVRLADEFLEKGAVFFIAEDEGKPIGFAKVRSAKRPEGLTAKRPMELERLYVLKEWIGKSVGKKLMEACMEHATLNDYDEVWLGVWEHNILARDFYKKWGFQRFGEHIFMLGDDPQTDWLLHKKL